MADSHVEVKLSNNDDDEKETGNNSNIAALEAKKQEKIETPNSSDDQQPDKKSEDKEPINSQELSAKKLKFTRGLRKVFKVRRYIDSVFVRLLFIGLPAYQIFFISCIYNQPFYYFLYASYIIIILDGVWVFWKRQGRDYYWFSISFATFILLMVILIALNNDYKYYEDDVLCETNRTIVNNIHGCYSSDGIYTICSMSEIIVVGFLATLVSTRWLMPPSVRMDREAIYFQIASFTTLSADVLEIAQYLQNEQVAKSAVLFRACEIVFGVSLLQFAFSLAAVKVRNMKLTGWRRLLDIILSTEAWSQLLALISQEIPCLVLRLILIFHVELSRDYSLVFFVLKNGLMVMLMTYRIIELCIRKIRAERAVYPLKIN